MKKFLIKLFVWQTLIYAILWLMFTIYEPSTSDGKILVKSVIGIYYFMSVLVTFVIPMIKELRNSTH